MWEDSLPLNANGVKPGKSLLMKDEKKMPGYPKNRVESMLPRNEQKSGRKKLALVS